MIAPMTDLAKRSARLLSLSLLLAAAVLAACHKSETSPEAGTPAASPAGSTPAASPAAAPGAPPPSTAPLKVVALTFGKSVGADQKVTAEADTFAPSDTIYAVVGTTGGSPPASSPPAGPWSPAPAPRRPSATRARPSRRPATPRPRSTSPRPGA